MYRNVILMNKCAHTRKNTAEDKKLCIHLMYSPMTSCILKVFILVRSLTFDLGKFVPILFEFRVVQ